MCKSSTVSEKSSFSVLGLRYSNAAFHAFEYFELFAVLTKFVDFLLRSAVPFPELFPSGIFIYVVFDFV